MRFIKTSISIIGLVAAQDDDEWLELDGNECSRDTKFEYFTDSECTVPATNLRALYHEPSLATLMPSPAMKGCMDMDLKQA